MGAAQDDIAGLWRPRASTQWILVVLAAAWCAALALALPAWASATAPADASLTAGQTVSAGGVTVIAPQGWLLDGDVPSLLKLEKADVNVLVFPPGESKQSPEEAVEAGADDFRADTSVRYEIGEPQSFRTSGGLAAARLVVVGADSVTTFYAVSDGERIAGAQVDASPAGWSAIDDEVQTLMESLAFQGGAP